LGQASDFIKVTVGSAAAWPLAALALPDLAIPKAN
jgi:hypothetical protein